MPKRPIGINVLDAAKSRVKRAFDEFEKIYVSFSGGKDSTVMIHLVAEEAKKRNKKIGVLIVDLEGQYKLTIDHMRQVIDGYKEVIDLHWVCLPISLRNAVSVFEPKWVCWEPSTKKDWIRNPPDFSVSDLSFYDFFEEGMEFEEFVPLFGEWYSNGKSCACFVGIRSDESLNRFRTISSRTKTTKSGLQWTTRVTENVYNVYPIYDWKTEDIWVYHAKNPDKPYNKLYDRMHMAGLSVHQMRICQPYGDDQRRGLWLFHLIEPTTWAKVVARVTGANSGALYVQESGNINGYNKVTLPEGHTWKSFAKLLLATLPPKTKEHFENKIILFVRWWTERGYSPDIPDEAPSHLESKRDVPSWRRVCKSILRNDYWCKGLGFSQHKSKAYEKYMALMRARRQKWQLDLFGNQQA